MSRRLGVRSWRLLDEFCYFLSIQSAHRTYITILMRPSCVTLNGDFFKLQNAQYCGLQHKTKPSMQQIKQSLFSGCSMQSLMVAHQMTSHAVPAAARKDTGLNHALEEGRDGGGSLR